MYTNRQTVVVHSKKKRKIQCSSSNSFRVSVLGLAKGTLHFPLVTCGSIYDTLTALSCTFAADVDDLRLLIVMFMRVRHLRVV